MSAFDLPENLSAKADPTLISTDDDHFSAIAESLRRTVADLNERLDVARRAPGGAGDEALNRDLEIHRLTSRLRIMRRFDLDVCLGRMVAGGEPTYVGRVGLTDSSGRRLLVDWRTPAAEPFFGATHANPMGLVSRRRYRWTLGRITDYWDEVFAADDLEMHAALDDQSAFIATLDSTRSARMRDVLATIQADQDAIIRAGARGTLVVDGGPGTGKTVVALHRTAYLLYADPRLGHRRGGVLFVGPSRPYLSYVGDVLPSLGEEGVRTCTVRDLVPEGATAVPEADPDVASLKASVEMVGTIEPAVRLYEEPPTVGMEVETPWSEVWLSARDWADAFHSPAAGIGAQRGSGRRLGRAARRSWSTSTRPTTRSRRSRYGARSRSTLGSARRSTAPGRCSSTRTSSATCGPCPPTCAAARRGCPRTTCVGSGVRRAPRGRCATCPCWTRPGTGWATPGRHSAVGARRQRPPRSARGWTTSSPTPSPRMTRT